MQDQQNRINNYVIGHPIGETKAERLSKRLIKNICKTFQPYNQYFQQFQPQYLVEPKPTMFELEEGEVKSQLSFPKQLEYVRGSTDNYIDEQHLQSMLMQDVQDRGLMQNQQSKSIILGNLIIIAHQCFLKSALLKRHEAQVNNQIALVYHQFPQPILQIATLQLQIIIIRCRYWIFIFDCVHNSIKAQKRFNSQITSFQKSINFNDQIVVCTYDHKCYYIYLWNFNNNEITQTSCNQSFWGVHSIININSRQFVLGLSNKIIIQDLRSKEVQTLKRVSQLGNDRFISMTNNTNSLFQFILAKSRNIEIFELRKLTLPLNSIQHHCQQSPPSCLFTFKWDCTYLIAYSPSIYGSTLLINIDKTILENRNKQQQVFRQIRCQPMLLFDAGKVYKGLHSISVSATVQDKNLNIFHFDKSQGICVETFRKQVNDLDSIIRIKPLIQLAYPQQPFKKWVNYKNIQPFISRDGKIEKKIQSEQSEQNEGQTELYLSKINYCSLDKFRNRISQILKIEGDSIKKSNEIPETYFSQTIQASQDQNWVDIVKYSQHHKKQLKITEQLIDFIQSQWKL